MFCAELETGIDHDIYNDHTVTALSLEDLKVEGLLKPQLKRQ